MLDVLVIHFGRHERPFCVWVLQISMGSAGSQTQSGSSLNAPASRQEADSEKNKTQKLAFLNVLYFPLSLWAEFWCKLIVSLQVIFVVKADAKF